MRYILDDNGYIEAVSCTMITCNNKSCTAYTGAIPEGYDSLLEWAQKANIRAYKIVDNNLTYDEEQDAILQNSYEVEKSQNSPALKKDISYTPVTITGLPSGSGYDAFYYKVLNMVFCRIYLTGKAYAKGTRHTIGTVDSEYSPSARTALAVETLQDYSEEIRASITSDGEITFVTSIAKESGDDMYIAGWWYVGG